MYDFFLQFKSLPSIDKAVMAKATPVPEKFSANFTDLFESLVPVNVQQSLAAYDTRKQEIVSVEIGKLRESTQLLNSILASLNLPAAIEDIGGEKVPQSLHEKCASVVQAGGLEVGVQCYMVQIFEFIFVFKTDIM